MARKQEVQDVEPMMDTDSVLDLPEVDEGAAEADERLEEIQDIVRKSIERAIDHYESDLGPDQAEATDYYMGRPFGDEEEGRSQVVDPVVRDATHAQIPSLIRIFTSPERAVEFRPRGPEDEGLAAQMTDYINYLIFEENPGVLIFDSWFKDALVRRTGWVKWWPETKNRVQATTHSGLAQQDVGFLLQDPDVGRVEVIGVEMAEDGERYDVRVTRQDSEFHPCFACIPPEEVVYTPNARNVDDASLLTHVREVPREDLVVLGIDEDLIEEAAGKQRSPHLQELQDARQHEGSFWDDSEDDTVDKSQRKVLFAEAYCLIDCDDDGIAELRMFQCVGPEFKIANGDGKGEIVDEVPLAFLTPHPEPHTIVGLSNHDLLKNIQRVNSQLERGMLDSLALALEPDTEVVEGEVNMSDLLSSERSKVIRSRRPGMMREIVHEFMGAAVLPVLAYQKEKIEAATGHTKAAAGLDADSLQSSTKAAVAATLSASQQRIEYIARIFAETGVKRLFKGLLRMVVKHQNQARMVRLRNQFVPIDPRHWDASMDVTVNVALGQGTPEDRINALAGIISAQRELMTVGAPLVSWVEIRNSLSKAAESAGFKNPELFFKPWGPEQQAQLDQAMAQQPPQPDAQMMLVQIEAERLKMEAQHKAATLELEREKLRLEDDREREKIARDFAAKIEEVKIKGQIEEAKLSAQVDRDRRAMDANDQKEAA